MRRSSQQPILRYKQWVAARSEIRASPGRTTSHCVPEPDIWLMIDEWEVK
jgi:hypothetical protein